MIELKGIVQTAPDVVSGSIAVINADLAKELQEEVIAAETLCDKIIAKQKELIGGGAE